MSDEAEEIGEPEDEAVVVPAIDAALSALEQAAGPAPALVETMLSDVDMSEKPARSAPGEAADGLDARLDPLIVKLRNEIERL